MLTSAIIAAMERGRDAAGLRAHCMLARAHPRTDMPVGSPERMHQAGGENPRGRKGKMKELGSCGVQDKAVDTFPLTYHGIHNTCGWQSLA